MCVYLGRARPLAVEWVVLHTGNIRAHTPARMHALTDTDPQHSGMYPPKATRTRTLSYTRARILAPPTKARSTYTSSLVVGVNLCVYVMGNVCCVQWEEVPDNFVMAQYMSVHLLLALHAHTSHVHLRLPQHTHTLHTHFAPGPACAYWPCP